ncbi:elongation of very long chain fatty acids protein 7-like isoform X1 [Uloborus diversus]|uniref:elongation of very long chain fatty acids protein 7-like isoform X1 n=1 Tax=Uloborus diversus TaxID=327109 RepID=UPI002409BD31|nr:elongation of very long chain fatty acids protein 7-like isoform X1 [Uloborus diversus]
MTAIEEKGYFYSGDPIIREWSLVKTNYWPFILCASYVFFVKRLGPHFMKNRKPFDLRRLMVVYNMFLVAAYSTCMFKLAYIFFTTDVTKTLCNPTKVLRNHYTYTACRTVWVIYLLKYIEFADTIFFVLRKKYHLVTNLHVIHHGVLPLLFWSGLRTETRGFRVILIYINSTVHAIMYTYYGLAAIGPQVQKYLWWKEHLTRLQMTQFAVILILGFFGSTLSRCTSSNRNLYSDMFFAMLFLILFYNFYTRTYAKKGSKNKPRGKHISENDSSFVSDWMDNLEFFANLRKDHV